MPDRRDSPAETWQGLEFLAEYIEDLGVRLAELKAGPVHRGEPTGSSGRRPGS